MDKVALKFVHLIPPRIGICLSSSFGPEDRTCSPVGDGLKTNVRQIGLDSLRRATSLKGVLYCSVTELASASLLPRYPLQDHV
jgi:hypothetical protein